MASIEKQAFKAGRKQAVSDIKRNDMGYAKMMASILEVYCPIKSFADGYRDAVFKYGKVRIEEE